MEFVMGFVMGFVMRCYGVCYVMEFVKFVMRVIYYRMCIMGFVTSCYRDT